MNDNEKLVADPKDIVQQPRAAEVRVETDFSPDPIKAKTAEAEETKVHTMFVIGARHGSR